MEILIQLGIGLLSFSIGMVVVGVVMHSKGILEPILRLLREQKILGTDVSALEKAISKKEQEIVQLKKKLKELKLKSTPTSVLGDENASSPAIEPLTTDDAVSLDNIETNYKPELNIKKKVTENDIASLEDMNERLKQISSIVESLPNKLSDVLRQPLLTRQENLVQLTKSIKAITNLGTLEQEYTDSVLNNATSKAEELEIKAILLKMKTSRASMYQAAAFVESNKTASLSGTVIAQFKEVLNINTP